MLQVMGDAFFPSVTNLGIGNTGEAAEETEAPQIRKPRHNKVILKATLIISICRKQVNNNNWSYGNRLNISRQTGLINYGNRLQSLFNTKIGTNFVNVHESIKNI